VEGAATVGRRHTECAPDISRPGQILLAALRTNNSVHAGEPRTAR